MNILKKMPKWRPCRKRFKYELIHIINLKIFSLMKNFDLNSFKSTELLKSNKGTKESIYKENVFEGANKEEFKKLRKKIRNLAENYFSSILAISDKSKAEKLAKDFYQFYTSCYKVNDFTLSSVCSANLEENKKSIFSKGIEKYKKILNK